MPTGSSDLESCCKVMIRITLNPDQDRCPVGGLRPPVNMAWMNPGASRVAVSHCQRADNATVESRPRERIIRTS